MILRVAWRYRLTVRTEPSQGLNTGSIPVSATNSSITYRHCGIYANDGGTPWHELISRTALPRAATNAESEKFIGILPSVFPPNLDLEIYPTATQPLFPARSV